MSLGFSFYRRLQRGQLATIVKIFAVCLSVGLLASCTATAETGMLEFRANGEDFVRQGFTSKDGWDIEFDQLLVTVSDLAAYQSSPPYDAASGAALEGTAVSLPNTYTVDLASGDADADPILIDTATAAPVGQYNAIEWHMVPASDGDAAGQTIRLNGRAQQGEQQIAFQIDVDDTYTYRCGEFVGDTRKGVVTANNTAEVEMTFHFDHLFGDADTPADDALNVGALGFEPLAQLAQGGVLQADLAMLQANLAPADFDKLQTTLQTLGHVGEGHCFETLGGFTDKE